LENPLYIDEPGCNKIGDIIVDMNNQQSNIEVSMSFGSTDIRVIAKKYVQ